MKTAGSEKHPKGTRRWTMTTKSTSPTKLFIYFRASVLNRLFALLLITNTLSVVFFLFRLIGAENFRYWFMLWNLALAWIAPFIALWLVHRLKKISWKHWSSIGLTLAWLLFLPNSFYMVSDLIHVQQTGEVNIIFDAVLFSSFIFNGFIAGYIGTYLVHRELNKRLSVPKTYAVIAGIFMLCSYAIYLGRVLRWNTWDALLNPAALLFDVSDTFIRPLDHPQAFVITFSFTLLITSFYLLAYELLYILRSARR
jgi:uncharacterized membrane protein